jgi:bifunctional UDP-N-acetylglucosamine pyrophosphorylase / glucosamine-1-phosphate N-acetyltransferase
MAAKDTVVIVLAAGKGTRLKSDVAKVLHPVGGRPLVEHVVHACLPLKTPEILVVVGFQADAVAAAVTPLGAETVVQNPQRGTGHAVQAARRSIRRSAKYAVVVPGDAPLLRTETLSTLINAHRSGGAAAAILTANLADPTGYGRVIRKNDDSVAAIIEESAASEEQRAIQEVNSSIYCFTLEKLWPCLAALKPENVHKELYLTDVIALLNERHERVLAVIAPDANEILGCNTRESLADVDRIFRRRKASELMNSGAMIYLPETVVADAGVTIGRDTVIEPGVQLLGTTKIGERCQIRSGSIIENSRIDDGVIIEAHCVIVESRLAKGTHVGPFARLRPGADLREGARVGNFVEVKNSTVHEGAKVPHLTYLGDASVGAGSNIGAGTITCNYDGVHKNPTTIGKGVFIGSDTALVAPIRIGDGAYVAAGSTITENVPADALAIARGRQVIKPGWAKARRRELAKAAKGRAKPLSRRPSKLRRARPRKKSSRRRR